MRSVEDDTEEYKTATRTVDRVWGHLEDAAAMWLVMGMDRDGFITEARKAYDFINRWHKQNSQPR